MNNTEDFLVEIGTEELPPKNLQSLATSFTHQLIVELKNSKLSHHECETFATPRRLAIIVNQLSLQQPNQTVERNGPFKTKAFDHNGKPTPAALGFAKSCGVPLEDIRYQETEKGPRLFFQQEVKGKRSTDILANIMNKVLSKLPINKPMRWGNQEYKFVRPVHWVVMMLGNNIVTGNILGQPASNITYGHRFHYPQAIPLSSPNEYAAILAEKGYVIANFEQRKQTIIDQLQNQKENVLIDDALANEVTALVEWPVALQGSFDKRFLQLPEEVLVTTMKVNQKYFSLVDKKNTLLPNFITISNIDSLQKDRVIKGNERVVEARLQDAEFFYQADIKTGLNENVQHLSEVLFQAKLGTLQDKTERIKKITIYLAEKTHADKSQSERAATLCKADLLTEMVTEFPELQGIMGYYYAKQQGEDNEVAVAIKEHYLPRYGGDDLPESIMGCIISLADKIDTLVGIFGINQAPTGVKDPYALRRCAIGLLRIMIEKSINIDLKALLEFSNDCYSVKLKNPNVVEHCFTFITDRLKNYYADRGISPDIFAAVVARKPTFLTDFDNRINAVKYFKELPEAKSLAAANKRVSNILKKQDDDISLFTLDESLFQQPAEWSLAKLVEEKNKSLDVTLKNAEYKEALKDLASLQNPVDTFFDDVMVMTDDKKLRENRLALLYKLRNLFLQVADISLLQSS